MPQIVSSLSISFFMMVWIIRATGAPSATTVLVLLAFPWVSFMFGGAMTQTLRLNRVVRPSFTIQFLLGFILISAILLAIRRFSSMDIRMPSLAIAISAFAWHGVFAERRRWDAWGDTSWSQALAINLALIGASFTSLCFASSSKSSWPSISLRRYLMDVEVVNLLASETPISVLGQPGLAQIPTSLNDSAGHVANAAFNAFTGLPIIETLGAMGYPLGMLVFMLGILSLIESWVDTRFSIYGLCLFLVLSFVGSASNENVSTFLIPGLDCRAAYGIGVGAVSILFFTRAISRGNAAGMALGVFLTILAGLFQQWVTVTCLVTIIFFVPCWYLISRSDHWNRAARHRQRVSARSVLALFLASGLLTLQLLWTFIISGATREAHSPSNPGETFGLTSQWAQCDRPSPLVISIFAFVCGVTVVARRDRQQQWRPFVGIVVIACGWYAVNFAVLRNSDVDSEALMANASAIWIYVLLAFFLGGLIFQFLGDVYAPLRRYELSILLIATALLGVVCGLRHRSSDAQTLLAIADHLPNGLRECARYIRDHSNAIDRIQDSDDDLTSTIEAITERRQYVGFAGINAVFRNPSLAGIFSDRRDEHRRWRQLSNVPDLLRAVRGHGIRWYLLHPDTIVRWPAEVQDACILEKEGYRVFDFRRLSSAN